MRAIKTENEYQVYGIPGCLHGETNVLYLRGKRKGGRKISLETLYNQTHGLNHLVHGKKITSKEPTYILCLKESGLLGYERMIDVVYSGKRQVWRAEFANGEVLTLTPDHEIKTANGFIPVSELKDEPVICRCLKVNANGKGKRKKRAEIFLKNWPFEKNKKIVRCSKTGKEYTYYRVRRARLVIEARMNDLFYQEYLEILNNGEWAERGIEFLGDHLEIHHRNGDTMDDSPRNLQVMTKEEHARFHGPKNQRNFQNVMPKETKLVSLTYIGEADTYDIQMAAPNHNFVANNIVVHNSGKTTHLAKSITRAAEKVGGHNLIVSSFTKAAAEVLVGRDLPVPAENIGTLHSLCYRGIGSPELAEKHINEFNERFPKHAISKSKKVDMDEGEADQNFDSETDKLFADYQVLRAKLVPREKWNVRVQSLAAHWELWKNENGYIDFTDMIELALHDMPYPPNNATIGIFDEAQDFTPLQMQLVRKWAKQLNYIMIAGDDDQCIFGFVGASPNVMLDAKVPDQRKTILDKSYRVPLVIQKHAQEWIERVRNREPKDQKPKTDLSTGEVIEGKLSRIEYSYKQAEDVVSFIESEASKLSEGETMMVIASCSYMIQPIVNEMRRRGLPFANKYKRKNGAWNPLKRSGTSTADRLLAYMEPEGPVLARRRLWSASQLAAWIELCQAKQLLKHGAKKQIQAAAKSDLSAQGLFDLISSSFLPEKINEAVQLDLDWFKRHVTSTKIKSVEYPMAILRRFGRDALDTTPKILPGTIHSVKGGEATKVLLFPDISMQAAQAAETISGKESIVRQFYVGMTRAEEELIIATPATSLHIPI